MDRKNQNHTPFLVATMLAVFVSTTDLSISLLAVPKRLESPGALLSSLTTTAIVVFFIFLLLVFLIRAVFKGARKDPFIISLAVFLGIFFLLAASGGLIRSRFQGLALFLALPYLLISGSIALLSFFIIRFLEETSQKIFVTLAFVLLFILAETMLVIWLYSIELQSSNPKTAIFVSLYLLGAILIFFFLWKVRNPVRIRFMISLLILVLFGLVGVQLSGNVSQGTYSGHRIPRVILITIDTLRADALSTYDPKQGVVTPHIDQFAKEGILFENAFSPSPWTWPSLVSIMTGQSPLVHQVLEYDEDIPAALPTLSEVMKKNGYLTSAFVDNIVLADKNISRGFLEYKSYPLPYPDFSLGSFVLDKFFSDLYAAEISTAELTNLTIRWLESNYRNDFFLWLHYYDPHLPYDPPPKYLPKEEKQRNIQKVKENVAEKIRKGNQFPTLHERTEIEDLYRAEVRYVDDSIGRLIQTLRKLKLYDDSLMILTSDHGEEFWEHGGFEHGHTLYNELLHVPLIIKLPKSAVTTRLKPAVSIERIMSTVLEFCKTDSKNATLLPDTLSAFWKKTDAPAEPVFALGNLYYEPKVAVLFERYKYVASLITGREELYDVLSDSEEQVSFATDSPHIVQQAKILLRETQEQSEGARRQKGIKQKSAEVSDEAKEILRSLGYIQ